MNLKPPELEAVFGEVLFWSEFLSQPPRLLQALKYSPRLRNRMLCGFYRKPLQNEYIDACFTQLNAHIGAFFLKRKNDTDI